MESIMEKAQAVTKQVGRNMLFCFTFCSSLFLYLFIIYSSNQITVNCTTAQDRKSQSAEITAPFYDQQLAAVTTLALTVFTQRNFAADFLQAKYDFTPKTAILHF